MGCIYCPRWATLLALEGTAQQVATDIGDAVDRAGAPDNHILIIVDLRTAQAG